LSRKEDITVLGFREKRPGCEIRPFFHFRPGEAILTAKFARERAGWITIPADRYKAVKSKKMKI
jgi:hypothetical protein